MIEICVKNIIFANIPLLGSIPQEVRKSQGNIENFEVFFKIHKNKIFPTARNPIVLQI
jgi:hypothetical protein